MRRWKRGLAAVCCAVVLASSIPQGTSYAAPKKNRETQPVEETAQPVPVEEMVQPGVDVTQVVDPADEMVQLEDGAAAESQENVQPAVPETETEIQDATSQELLDAVMGMNPEDAAMPLTEMPQYAPTPYVKEFTYNEDVVFSGIFDTNNLYFKVQNYWNEQYAYARVQFTLSQMIGDGPASLTFSVNNEPIYSCKVDYQNGREQIAYVPIPVEMLRKGFNNFGVSGYVRIYDEEGCIDDLSGANWVRLEQSSFVAVGYDVIDAQNQIAWYPYPYLSTTDELGSQTVVATSDAIDEAELSAALLLRADLSAETDTQDSITLSTFSKAENYNKKVLVSLLKNLPSEYKKMLPSDAGDLKERAVVTAFGEDDDRTLLIVSEDGDCLTEAAMMLADETRVNQEMRSTAYIKKDASKLMKEALSYSDENAAYTLTSLAGGGLSYVGPFHQKQTIYLPFSGGYVLAGTGKIDLAFRYSENLDFSRSLITVYWGETPVASKKLTKENAGDDTLSFSLPADVIGQTAGSIQVVFDLELPELFCSPRMDEMPWAYVAETSTFYLPVGKTGELSFDNQPVPFELSNRFNEVTVVIPDSISDVELNTLGQVATLYGVNISPYGSIDVVRARNFDGKTMDRNLIVLGSYKDNALLQELNSQLSFRYEEDGSRFASNRTQLLSDEFAGKCGIMQLIHSPYGEGRALLAVCATDENSMVQMGEYLQKDSNTWKLKDDVVLFEPNGEIRTYKFLKESEVQTPDLKQFVKNNRDTVLFTVVAVSSMMILLLAVVLILIRIYLARRKEEK